MSYPDNLIDEADLTGFDEDQLAIWDAQLTMYAGFLTGDQARTDERIAHDVTIWDSGVEAIADGLAAFDVLRAARPPVEERPKVLRVVTYQPIITVWGDTAIGRHALAADYVDDAAPHELVRVSTAWRRREGRWMLVHSHEDLFSTGPTQGA